VGLGALPTASSGASADPSIGASADRMRVLSIDENGTMEIQLHFRMA
jgi:hypothetical protein